MLIYTVNSDLQINKYWGRKVVNIIQSISVNICFGRSKELSHLDGSFKYPQHMFWLFVLGA